MSGRKHPSIEQGQFCEIQRENQLFGHPQIQR